jgi:hypothetical protein
LKLLMTLCSALLIVAGASPSASAGQRPTYRHAYYLFFAESPKGCEDCYVPLLITADPLEQIGTAASRTDCVLIITYERDSIWHDDGVVTVNPADIEAGTRTVHLRGRKYRYQEVSSAEVVKLLEHPMGTIPISRPMLPMTATPGPTLDKLVADFRSAK